MPKLVARPAPENMPQTEPSKPRGPRRRIHFRLSKLEPSIDGYRATPDQVEARILCATAARRR